MPVNEIIKVYLKHGIESPLYLPSAMALDVVEMSLCPEERVPDTSLIQFWVAVKEETPALLLIKPWYYIPLPITLLSELA